MRSLTYVLAFSLLALCALAPSPAVAADEINIRSLFSSKLVTASGGGDDATAYVDLMKSKSHSLARKVTLGGGGATNLTWTVDYSQDKTTAATAITDWYTPNSIHGTTITSSWTDTFGNTKRITNLAPPLANRMRVRVVNNDSVDITLTADVLTQ